jgi:hypothetical protein
MKWKKIDNFDNYEVSELGIVRSVDTTVVCKNNRKLPLKVSGLGMNAFATNYQNYQNT